MSNDKNGFVKVATLDEVKTDGARAVRVDHRSIALFWYEGQVYATDNQCPHMGYPLTRGRVRNGVLTCDWHGWSYDLRAGGCFTGGCDDLETYPVEVRGDGVYLNPEGGAKRKEKQHLLLQEGLNSGDAWTLSKAIAIMLAQGVSEEETLAQIIRHADRRAPSNCLESGCEELGRILNGIHVARQYPDEERLTPLMMAASGGAGQISNRPVLQPLPAPINWEKLEAWIRLFSTDIRFQGVEIGKCLLTAHRLGGYDDRILPLMYACITSPNFLEYTHTLIYMSHLAEALDAFGWEQTERLMIHLGGMLLGHYRSAPDETRQHALDLFKRAEAWIDDAISSGNNPSTDFDEETFVRGLVSGHPDQTFEAVSAVLKAGVDLDRIITAMVLTAADRMARTPVNLNPGWHELTVELLLASSLRKAGKFGGEKAAARGLYHAAWQFYSDRWLNITPGDLYEAVKTAPTDADEESAAGGVIRSIDTIQVRAVGRQTRAYFQAGFDGDRLLTEIGRSILNDDTGGGLLNILSVVFEEWEHCAAHPARYKLLVGLARMAADVRKGTENQSAAQTAQRFAKGQTATALYES